jgi:3-oxoacyl-[acyl-carrier-protein] synthase-3
MLSIRTKITAVGSYVPEQVLTNKDIEKRVDTSDDWIVSRTGIKERRIAKNHEAASDLALIASQRAIESAGLKPKDIDLILVTTMTGDMPIPSTASFLQNKLGARYIPAFDVNAACSGFLYGLAVADSFVRANNGLYKRVLLVGTEVMSAMIDWQDRSTCILFGDGAGAVILEPTNKDQGIISTRLFSDGSLWNLVHTPGGGSVRPATEESVKSGMHYIKMKGNETFRNAVKALGNLLLDTLKENGLEISQIERLIPHQANLRILQAIAQRVGLPMDKVFVNIEKYGNTSAASIPIALDEAVQAGLVTEGGYIVMVAFGSGLTWASALIKW